MRLGRVLAAASVSTAVLVLVLASGFTLGATVVGSSASTSCSAKISSVTPIYASKLDRTITITGNCLGQNPRYVSLGGHGAGKDTWNCGTGKRPAMHIIDWASHAGGRWSAGRDWGTGGTCMNVNAIGLKYASWNDTTIVIHGFGDALSTCDSGSWSLCTGDSIAVVVFNPPCTTGTCGYNYTLTAK